MLLEIAAAPVVRSMLFIHCLLDTLAAFTPFDVLATGVGTTASDILVRVRRGPTDRFPRPRCESLLRYATWSSLLLALVFDTVYNVLYMLYRTTCYPHGETPIPAGLKTN